MTTKKHQPAGKKASAPARTETRPLNAKVLRFVDEYLVDLNATQAAKRAGYSAKTAYAQGQRLLKNAEVQAAVQAAMHKRAVRTEITQDMVLRELAKIGFSDIRKVVTWGNTELQVGVDDEGKPVTEVYHGLVLVGADNVDDDTAAAIAEISQGKEGLKVKLYDKKAALVDIGKHIGMFIDRKEIRMGELERASDEELAQKTLVAAQQVADLEGVPVETVLQQVQDAASTTVH